MNHSFTICMPCPSIPPALRRLHAVPPSMITVCQVLVGHPDYEVTGGSVTYNGRDLLSMEPEERSHAGVFLSFQVGEGEWVRVRGMTGSRDEIKWRARAYFAALEWKLHSIRYQGLLRTLCHNDSWPYQLSPAIMARLRGTERGDAQCTACNGRGGSTAVSRGNVSAQSFSPLLPPAPSYPHLLSSPPLLSPSPPLPPPSPPLRFLA